MPQGSLGGLRFPSSTRRFCRQVLRFFAVWDDRETLYGDYRPYVVLYYLENDTVEVLEVHEPNSGRDPYPKLLSRAPLPKPVEIYTYSPTAPRPTKRGEPNYRPEDLRIGSYIYVHKRPFLLYDCDDFTRSYYQTKLGYSDDMLAPMAVDDPAKEPPHRIIPPYNGARGPHFFPATFSCQVGAIDKENLVLVQATGPWRTPCRTC